MTSSIILGRFRIPLEDLHLATGISTQNRSKIIKWSKVYHGSLLHVFFVDFCWIWKRQSEHEQWESLFGPHYAHWLWVSNPFAVKWCFLSVDVRFHLWKRLGNHSTTLFWNRSVSCPDEPRSRVHPIPPNSESSSTATRRVFSTRMVVHKRHRHDNGSQGISWMSPGRHCSSFESKFAQRMRGFRWHVAWMP